MRWLLDSNVLIDALAGLPHGRQVLFAARVTRNTDDFNRVLGLTVVHPDNV